MRNVAWQNAAWGTMMIYLSANHTFVQDASRSLNFSLMLKRVIMTNALQK